MRHALGVDLAAAQQEAAPPPRLLQQVVAEKIALRRDLDAVAVDDRLRRLLGEQLHQLAAERLHIQNIVLDRACARQQDAHALIVELGPQDARRVEQVDAALHAEPLAAARHARLVRRLGGLAAEDAIDKGGFAHVRDADHHHAHRLAHKAFFVPLGDLIRQQRAHCVCERLRACAGAAVGLDDRHALTAEVFCPLRGLFRVRQIDAVEDHQPRLARGDLVHIRVARHLRDARVHDLADRVHLLDILRHLPAGPGHVPGIPLNVHRYATDPNSLNG